MSMPNYYGFHRQDILQLLPPEYSKILEIGCAAGKFRANLDKPHEYWGVEPDPEVAREAETVLDRVFAGSYEAVQDQLPDGYFDLVICNDVIEHMPDHDAFLREIKAKIAPGGHMVISVPNVRFIWNLWEVLIEKDWRYRDAGVLDRTHLRFFTLKSLRRSLDAAAYRVKILKHINTFKPGPKIRRLIYYILPWLLGRDIRYLQVGALIQKP